VQAHNPAGTENPGNFLVRKTGERFSCSEYRTSQDTYFVRRPASSPFPELLSAGTWLFLNVLRGISCSTTANGLRIAISENRMAAFCKNLAAGVGKTINPGPVNGKTAGYEHLTSVHAIGRKLRFL
jgi:hypothetical protein